MMNYGVFIIECRMDAAVFMAALVRYLYVLADRYPDISNTRPGIYAGGSMAMVRHGLMHSVNDVDIAFRDRELANALRNTYGKDYFKNYKFAGVDIDFGPAAAVLLEAAAIPHWFNHDILAALLPDTAITDEMYTGLISLPFVESFKGKGYNVHEATRKALRQQLAHTSPETMRLLSGYAAGYFSFYPDDLPERIYHQTVVDPSEAKVLAHEAKHIWLQTNKPELIHRLHHNVQELDGF